MSGSTSTFWRGKSVLITGHTGFKGSWLTLMLHQMGAKVHGLALAPPTTPSLFEQARVGDVLMTNHCGDIRDADAVATAMAAAEPDVLLHLAAQPLVRESYRTPVGTIATNVVGLAQVLDAARRVSHLKAIVNVTTDKCYENGGWIHPYRETDPMGGHDPYSASKGAAELITAAYRASFFDEGATRLATARAGNVIGGGDWAVDRLLPDCMRAFAKGAPVVLRYPHAVRPWQHVLESLSGYLHLAEALCGDDGADFAEGWNFGPSILAEGTVSDVAHRAAAAWGEADVAIDTADADLSEAHLLRIDSSKAHILLDWRDRWTLDRAVAETVAWYRAAHEQQDMRAFTEAQIKAFLNA